MSTTTKLMLLMVMIEVNDSKKKQARFLW